MDTPHDRVRKAREAQAIVDRQRGAWYTHEGIPARREPQLDRADLIALAVTVGACVLIVWSACDEDRLVDGLRELHAAALAWWRK